MYFLKADTRFKKTFYSIRFSKPFPIITDKVKKADTLKIDIYHNRFKPNKERSPIHNFSHKTKHVATITA